VTDVENAMKVGIAEALKHEVKLVEKLGPIVTLLWRWHVAKGFIRSLEFPFPKLWGAIFQLSFQPWLIIGPYF
jgi:hypothetical protein